MKYLKILFLMLLAFYLSSCSVCLAGNTTNHEMTIAVPVTRLQELQTIILKQESQLQTLQASLIEPQATALKQAKQLQEAQSSIATLQTNLKNAQSSLLKSSETILEQNKSLRNLSDQMKQERNKWKIKTVKWCLIGFIGGYLYKELKELKEK